MKVKQILVTIFISTLVGLGVWFYKSKGAEIKYQFPYTEKLRDTNQFTCDVMISTMVYGANNNVGEKGVFGRMELGTDKIAIEIDEDSLHFLTEAGAKAAVESGNAKQEDEPWTLTRNDKDYITAIYSGSGILSGNAVNIVMIRKSNGMGVWTKTRDNMLGTDTPDAQSFMLKCR